MASFMESKASSLVDEFMLSKELWREKHSSGRTAGDPEEEIVRGVVDSFKNVIEIIKVKDLPPSTVRSIFTSIFSGIQALLPNGGNLLQTTTTTTTSLPPLSVSEDLSTQGLSHFSEWPHICHLLWYPYHRQAQYPQSPLNNL